MTDGGKGGNNALVGGYFAIVERDIEVNTGMMRNNIKLDRLVQLVGIA